MKVAGKEKPRIVFMGTPAFAVASLEALLSAGFNVVGVVTAPDRPAGRGMKLGMSAVKKFAIEKQLDILQPEKLKDPGFLASLKTWNADIQVVVAFRMLPASVWGMPPLGTLNLHASLLPKYRGAAPINWAIINGEKITGVTTFRLAHEIDTGNILLQREVAIRDNETAGELHDRLQLIGAELLVETITGMLEGTVTGKPQSLFGLSESEIASTHAPKLTTETGRVNWKEPVEKIYDLIRGLSPVPCAFTTLDGKLLKIYRAEKIVVYHDKPPGIHETDGKNYLRFTSAGGYIDIRELQLEGKKKMGVEEFLRGYRIVN